MDTKQRLSSALTSSFPELFRLPFTDRGGERDVSVRVLQGLGRASSYLTPAKIRDLWIEYAKHDVLFSDYTVGKVEPFVTAIFNPRSFWFELFDLNKSKAIGLAMLTDIIPQYDAKGHFAFWDKIGSGRETLIWELMEICFDEFDLHRMTVETPAYQRGTIRSIKRLGFTHEGEKREGVFHKSTWINMMLFGITREELRRVKDVGRPVRGREEWHSNRDEGSNGECSLRDQSVPSGRGRSDGESPVSELNESAGI